MILKKFSYTDNLGRGYRLHIDEIPFNYVNLIVGRNSVGKSTTTHLINNLARMISQKTFKIFNGENHFLFQTDNGKEIEYNYRINASSQIEEELFFENKKILNRKDGDIWIYSFKEKKNIQITPPEKKLILHVRRDKEDYPIIEEIVHWAGSTHLFKFGMLSPEDISFKDPDTERVAGFIDVIPFDIDNMNKEDKKILFHEMASLNYFLEDVNVLNKDSFSSTTITIQEKGVVPPIFHFQLSQGMLRTLFLLIYINSRIKEGKTSTLIIDDLCEGLDYDRATKLGKLLIEKFKDNNIQLIATSNDSFLMDVFPIKYWNILTRKNNVVKSSNYENSKEKFDEFKFTGLSNFDLFSSDYLL